ncbi:MAG: hypothetical protein K1X72_10385 [Pyrinomonadaceae bacterium]|nr:hypothetical protein [Pyrinomonadaceae bacterium]
MSFTNHSRCTALSKRTKQKCKNIAVRGSTKCRNHGGKTPRGVASTHYKNGLYSRYLPQNLLGRFESVENDKELSNLKAEMALVTVRIQELLDQLNNSSEAKKNLIWSRIDLLIERKRRLVHTELSRLHTLQNFIPTDEAILMVNSIITTVKAALRGTEYERVVLQKLDALARQRIGTSLIN